MKQGLQTRQSQSMVMTPQMQESIKILQLSTVELAPYIATELEQNPFLERDENDDNTDGATESSSDAAEATKIEAVDKPQNNWEDDEISPAVYNSEGLIYSNAGSGKDYEGGDGENMLENIASPTISLRDHIINQITSDIKDAGNRMIALHLTEYLDESGYIIQDITPLSQLLQCKPEQIKEVLGILQHFDPSGVFSRDLAECLGQQLKDRNRYDPAMQALVANLDLMAKCDFKQLKKICGVSDEDLREMFAEIRALNPKPGNNFSSENVQVLQADVFLKKDAKGNWLVELNSDALPRVLLSRRYYAQIEEKVKDKQSKKFMSERWNTANWLIRALDQRANTILKVATEIVLQQSEFFKKGIHCLKPLVISDIAGAVEAHESTISRVINGKYIATHMGTYELKYFFSSGVGSSEGGDDISSKRIKFMIKQLVDAESPEAILSDDKLAIMLKTKGIEVARRTVMKYREAMNIPSSVQRRREKGMG
jgi:RNA polymerase sigma-54 factor